MLRSYRFRARWEQIDAFEPHPVARLCGGLDAGEREKIRKALLDYCGQDTLAMLRLVERLQHVSE
jgi:hypothetical protein